MEVRELNFRIAKGDTNSFDIMLSDAVTFRKINSVIKTKDRWIKVQKHHYSGKSDKLAVDIVTRGLWEGFHRGIIRVNEPDRQEEYIINLFIRPKRSHKIM